MSQNNHLLTSLFFFLHFHIQLKSRDLKNAGFVFHFNKHALVWHNDDSYTEWNNQTLFKSLISEHTGMSFFPPEDENFVSLKESLTNDS